MSGLNLQRPKNLTQVFSFPNLSSTLLGWEVPLTLEKVYQDVVEGDFTYTTQKINFKGVWQPLKDEALELKPDGQRSWEWYWIHAVTGTLNLETADKIIFNGEHYKVMEKKDYSLNGFVEYQVIKDYEGNSEENAEIN